MPGVDPRAPSETPPSPRDGKLSRVALDVKWALGDRLSGAIRDAACPPIWPSGGPGNRRNGESADTKVPDVDMRRVDDGCRSRSNTHKAEGRRPSGSLSRDDVPTRPDAHKVRYGEKSEGPGANLRRFGRPSMQPAAKGNALHGGAEERTDGAAERARFGARHDRLGGFENRNTCPARKSTAVGRRYGTRDRLLVRR